MKCKFILLILTILLPMTLQASPTSPAMIDGDGCHICQDICEKFGVQKQQKHCHIFSPEAVAGYKKASQGTATNSEAMYANNLLQAMKYVSLTEDGKRLLIGAIKKNIVGTYKVVAQSCGLGSDPLQITKGGPTNIKTIFDSQLNPQQEGLYTINISKKDFLVIGTSDSRLLVIGDSDEIVCGGQSVKDKLYLFCQPRFTGNQRVGKGGYCRTSLIKE